jgi:membrane-associated phospholipid phosphatase
MIHIIAALDASTLGFLFDIRSMPVTFVMMGITLLGEYKVVLVAMAAVAAGLLMYRKAADVAGLLVATLGSAATTLLLKMLVARPRPEAWYQVYSEGPHWSFPSAHAALAVAFYGYILYLLLQSRNTFAHRIIIGTLAVLIPMIALSRLYLGVHYLSDVLVGLAIGAVFLFLGRAIRIHLLDYWNKTPLSLQ